jgi:Glycosyl transferase family 2
MQIEVVDNCSTVPGVEQLVKEVGKGRVAFWRQPENIGMVGNWNSCLARARGRWVHLLHDDDLIRKGFYLTCEQLIAQHPEIAMIFGQVTAIDEVDRSLYLMGAMPPRDPVIVSDFTARQAFRQEAQFAGVAVRRAAFEQVGGFCSYFIHVADMDMWYRISRVGSVVQTREPFGQYRIHAGTDTNRVMVSGKNIEETVQLVLMNLVRSPEHSRSPLARVWQEGLAQYAERTAWQLDDKSCFEGRLKQAQWAWRLAPNFRRLLLLFKSWVKCRLSGRQVRPAPDPANV